MNSFIRWGFFLDPQFFLWMTHPAKWWQFWYPGSGFAGGSIVALIICVGLAQWFL